MRIVNRVTRCLCLLAVLMIAAIGQTARAQTPPPAGHPTVYLIGDSTVHNNTKDQLGWGEPFIKLFDPAKVTVVNRAIGGRSSRTFYTEGRWDAVAKELKPGDFVLMQFGHNDGGGLSDPRGRASIKGNGDETQEAKNAKGEMETVHSYGWYLRKYIADTKAKGATPIVLSPVPRNIWKDGKIGRASNDYGKWAMEAAQQGGALFMDLNGLVAARYEKEGQETVAKTYFGATDHTHTTPAGAEVTAGVVAEGLRDLKDCPLKDYLLPAGK